MIDVDHKVEVLAFHRITPRADFGRLDNGSLAISPDRLSEILRRLARRGCSILTMREALGPANGDGRDGVVLTFDDGYRDFIDYALPVLAAHSAPATLFLSSGFLDRDAFYWWFLLEAYLVRERSLSFVSGGRRYSLGLRSDREKCAAWDLLHGLLKSCNRRDQEELLGQIFASEGWRSEIGSFMSAEAMSWSDARQARESGLVTIGAHSRHHLSPAALSDEEFAVEVNSDRERLASELGAPPDLFSYPYGGSDAVEPRHLEIVRRAGFNAAVVTSAWWESDDGLLTRFRIPRTTVKSDTPDSAFVPERGIAHA